MADMKDSPNDTPPLLSLIRDLFFPAIYIGVGAYPFLLVFGPNPIIGAAIAVAVASFVIRFVVRSINLRDDPALLRLPPEEP